MPKDFEEKLKSLPFVVDWNKGERAYQTHIFESSSNSDYIIISSKITAEGRIEAHARLSKSGILVPCNVGASTKEDFKKAVEQIKNGFEKMGFTHWFVDLSNCNTPGDAAQLLEKSGRDIKIEIKHKSEI